MNDFPPQVKTKGRKILEFALLIALFFFGFAFLIVIGEDKIVYHPSKYPAGFWQPESYGLQVEDVYFTAPDGVKLHAWFVPAKDPLATLLWYHGNAGNLTHRLENILALRPLRLNIFIFDYRGYGRSEGKPGQKGIFQDSQAAYDYLTLNRKIAPDNLFLFGRSLGGACAIEIAAKNKAAGLIVESAFTSVKDMANKMFPFFPFKFLLRNKYDALGAIASVDMPKLFLHGAEDELVPYSMGQKLFAAARAPKEFYAIKGAGHNDTYAVGGKEYFDTLGRFIQKYAQTKNYQQGNQ